MARDRRKAVLRAGALLDECQICCPKSSYRGSVADIEKVCGGCSVYAELREIGARLQDESSSRFKAVLNKGQEMTRADIALLLENDVQKKDIRKALQMGVESFDELMANFGFYKKNYRKGVDKVAMAESIKLSVDEYSEFKSQGLKDIDIANKLGVNRQQMANWKHYRKDKLAAAGLAAPVREASVTVVDKETVQQAPISNKTDEYAALIEELSDALVASKKSVSDRDILIGHLQEKIKNYESIDSDFQQVAKKAGEHEAYYKDEIGKLHAACEDVESELETVRKERDRLIQNKYLNSYTIENQKKSLEDKSKQLKKFSEENVALRKLVQLWS